MWSSVAVAMASEEAGGFLFSPVCEAVGRSQMTRRKASRDALDAPFLAAGLMSMPAGINRIRMSKGVSGVIASIERF